MLRQVVIHSCSVSCRTGGLKVQVQSGSGWTEKGGDGGRTAMQVAPEFPGPVEISQQLSMSLKRLSAAPA